MDRSQISEQPIAIGPIEVESNEIQNESQYCRADKLVH